MVFYHYHFQTWTFIYSTSIYETSPACLAQREGFFNIGLGRVRYLKKSRVSGWGSGRVGVLKYAIGYFRVPYLISGIPGHFWYSRVFCREMEDFALFAPWAPICEFQKLIRILANLLKLENWRNLLIGTYLKCPVMSGYTWNFGFNQNIG